MNKKDLTYFSTIYEEKSINKAAKKLFITSQGLSKVINNLEDELGAKLFTRTQKGVFPTESADYLYEKSNDLLMQFEEIESRIKQIESRGKNLKISCSYGVLNALSSQIIFDFIEKYSDIDVQWGESPNFEVKDMVDSFKTDLGIVVGKSKNDQIEESLISTRKIELCVYKGHKFYDRDWVSISDLKDEKIIILNKNYHINSKFKEACAKQGFNPDIKTETGDIHFLHKLCKQKIGVGIVMDFSMDNFEMEDMKTIPISDGMTWDIYLIYNKQNQSSTNIDLFKKYINKHLNI